MTVIVTTHFMEEAEYCDRVAILDAGRMLAQGTPASMRQQATHEARRGNDGGRIHRASSSRPAKTDQDGAR